MMFQKPRISKVLPMDGSGVILPSGEVPSELYSEETMTRSSYWYAK